MGTVSSKEYAANVEDVICEELTRAVGRAWGRIAMAYGFAHKFPVDSVMDAYEMSALSSARDGAIALFEECGMDITSDGKEF